MKLRKTIPLSILLFLFTINLFAQVIKTAPPPPPPPPPPEPEVEKIFHVVEDYPVFPGCEEIADKGQQKKCADEMMLDYISVHLEYPELAKSNKIEGVVVISFMVEKDGTMSDIKILRDIGANCGKAALAVFEKMKANTKWNVGKSRGRPVKVRMNMPVRFKLPKEKKTLIPEDGSDDAQMVNSDFLEQELDYDSPPPSNKYAEDISKIDARMPLFPGCEDVVDATERKVCSDNKLVKYVSEKLIYPIEAKSKKIEGTVVINFVVQKNGLIKNPRILRDIGGGCGDAALDVFYKMQAEKIYWAPGINKGEPVEIQFNMPVKFKLPKKKR